ncbi:hypothetical protein SAMN05444157_2431 [Frankineae bacterium MT45]|nr:hypothetical protein SAMN05444157_2431 [Frankineae bacterium MT45]
MNAPDFPSAPKPGPGMPMPGPVAPMPGPGGFRPAAAPTASQHTGVGNRVPTAQPAVSETDASAQPPNVTAAVELLNGIEARPVAEHVEIYADVHARLQRALTEIDTPDR